MVRPYTFHRSVAIETENALLDYQYQRVASNKIDKLLEAKAKLRETKLIAEKISCLQKQKVRNEGLQGSLYWEM